MPNQPGQLRNLRATTRGFDWLSHAERVQRLATSLGSDLHWRLAHDSEASSRDRNSRLLSRNARRDAIGEVIELVGAALAALIRLDAPEGQRPKL